MAAKHEAVPVALWGGARDGEVILVPWATPTLILPYTVKDEVVVHAPGPSYGSHCGHLHLVYHQSVDRDSEGRLTYKYSHDEGARFAAAHQQQK